MMSQNRQGSAGQARGDHPDFAINYKAEQEIDDMQKQLHRMEAELAEMNRDAQRDGKNSRIVRKLPQWEVCRRKDQTLLQSCRFCWRRDRIGSTAPSSLEKGTQIIIDIPQVYVNMKRRKPNRIGFA
jgi:hypothetical protein